MFGSESNQKHSFQLSKEKFQHSMDLLLIGTVGNLQGSETQSNKLHYAYIKYFNRFMYTKIKHKENKVFL